LRRLSLAMKKSKTSVEKGAIFKVGDKVRVRDMPYMFYTRSQLYTRGVVGTIAALTYKDLIPEEEAFNFDGSIEQYYIVRFHQKDLWPGYPFDNDTLQTECPHRWLEPATN
jgi:thiocyanate hydrolase subunit beta